MLQTYHVSDLEQIRLLADPLKLRIIRSLAEGPKTTREVADHLGENLTRLYRHVDALCDAGLIEVTSERKKRGTIERTFQAIAKRFEVDHALFANQDGNQVMREHFRAAEDEIVAALNAADGDLEPLCMRLQLEASPEKLRQLRAMLEDWLQSAQTLDSATEGDDLKTAGALLVFYPLAGERPRD